MDNDQRDRQDWPASDEHVEGGAEPGARASASDEPAAAESAEGVTPEPAEPVMSEPTGQAMEPIESASNEPEQEPEPAVPATDIESWPSQDAAVRDDPASPPWPTEPPAAGSGGADTWPTSAPEPGDQAAAEAAMPEPESATPPAAEVEAYPASASAATPPEPAMAGDAPAQVVPDAAAATGESTQCPRCGTENRAGLAFCRNCGQRLVAAGAAATVARPSAPEGTMACPRCGTHNRAGVAFCQNCGANLRGTAEGYVPPAVAGASTSATATAERRGAVLGPVVLLIGIVGLVTGYLLPFAYGADSLFDRAWGSGGYGIAFWSGYPDVGAGLADQAYFGLTAPVLVLGLILLLLAIAGFARAAPGGVQRIGLVVALLWSVALVVLFLAVEVAGNWSGDLVGLLRDLTPAGIIFFLASLITLIGTLTRFGRA